MASDAAETTINVLATIATICIFISMVPGMNNSMGWVIYSLADHAFFPVGAVNCLGAVLGVIFSGIFILHEKELRTRYSLFFCGVFALIVALLLYRFLATQDDDSIAKVLGYFAMAMAIIMFGSPLMLMGDVIKTKNSEIIAAPMAISGIVNGALWTTYGIMQSDYYVLVPNAISGILCLVQVGLVLIFPRSLSGEKKGELSEKLSVNSEV
ncbi:SWEET sugar transporter [Phytophthora cactorum]|nr:SWEET sugar transporter [Phytophthora cactorum]